MSVCVCVCRDGGGRNDGVLSTLIPRPPSLVMGVRLHSTHIGWTGICPGSLDPQPLSRCHPTIGGPPRIERRLKGASTERNVRIQT